MCQNCVDSGRYTQQEYDQRVLDGDTGVMSLMDLNEHDVLVKVASMTHDAIERGMDRDRAMLIGAIMLFEYEEVTGRALS